jgi:hypothetical protein
LAVSSVLLNCETGLVSPVPKKKEWKAQGEDLVATLAKWEKERRLSVGPVGRLEPACIQR